MALHLDRILPLLEVIETKPLGPQAPSCPWRARSSTPRRNRAGRGLRGHGSALQAARAAAPCLPRCLEHLYESVRRRSGNCPWCGGEAASSVGVREIPLGDPRHSSPAGVVLTEGRRVPGSPPAPGLPRERIRWFGRLPFRRSRPAVHVPSGCLRRTQRAHPQEHQQDVRRHTVLRLRPTRRASAVGASGTGIRPNHSPTGVDQ